MQSSAHTKQPAVEYKQADVSIANCHEIIPLFIIEKRRICKINFPFEHVFNSALAEQIKPTVIGNQAHNANNKIELSEAILHLIRRRRITFAKSAKRKDVEKNDQVPDEQIFAELLICVNKIECVEKLHMQYLHVSVHRYSE
ncbi:hypothetical protein T4C_808 [Trichinella pseudospiralis]|uniref:Uncharacterized protein n=1 Tax=Trichinella pseudospiralis TaxID=6337 RepID=A0A0V1JWL6_TRIPS|nr:hypothetical protein T4C_808 [Trichinella pseudospiralis]